LIGAVAYVAENPSRFGRYFGEAFWLPTIVLGAIVAYLLQPDVQLAFGARKGYYDEYSPREVEAGEYGLKNPAERD
jgi:hypothetical protein